MPGFEIDLAPRDLDILETLTHKVRTLSAPQIARTWWPGASEIAARRRLTLLESAGLLSSCVCFCHPEISLQNPVVSWSPNAPEPDFGQASYRLKSRWYKSPESLDCFLATVAAGRFLGGYGGRFSRESEQTHDLHLSAIFLNLRRTNQLEARSWMSEEAIRASRSRRNEKLPDAMIQRNGANRFIEFGGAYSKEKLSLFHAYCRDNDTAYEVW